MSRVTARHKANQLPIPLHMMTLPKQKKQWSHHVAWKHNTCTYNKADSKNSACETHQEPCIRRWMEFRGRSVPAHVAYTTCYAPPPICSRPQYTWTLVSESEGDICTFTNSLEAWMILLAYKQYLNREDVLLIYTELY